MQQQHAYLSEMHCQRSYTHWLGTYEEITYSFPVEQGSQQTAHLVTDCVESTSEHVIEIGELIVKMTPL